MIVAVYYTCQGSLVQQHKDRPMVLGQSQTAEDLFGIIAWKIAKHHINVKTSKRTFILQWRTVTRTVT